VLGAIFVFEGGLSVMVEELLTYEEAAKYLHIDKKVFAEILGWSHATG